MVLAVIGYFFGDNGRREIILFYSVLYGHGYFHQHKIVGNPQSLFGFLGIYVAVLHSVNRRGQTFFTKRFLVVIVYGYGRFGLRIIFYRHTVLTHYGFERSLGYRTIGF